MYIILKGKIGVFLAERDKPDIQKHISSMEDGECFGEFSMIDQSKIQTNESLKEEQLNSLKNMQRSNTAVASKHCQPRTATCRAFEETWCLSLAHYVAGPLFQPGCSEEMTDENAKFRSNELGHKIDFLRETFDAFKKIPDIKLMPIALNMQQVNFGFGDYLQKEGEVPKGLYLIKSGQCRVCKTKVSTRPCNPKEIQK